MRGGGGMPEVHLEGRAPTPGALLSWWLVSVVTAHSPSAGDSVAYPPKQWRQSEPLRAGRGFINPPVCHGLPEGRGSTQHSAPIRMRP